MTIVFISFDVFELLPLVKGFSVLNYPWSSVFLIFFFFFQLLLSRILKFGTNLDKYNNQEKRSKINDQCKPCQIRIKV